MRACRQLQGARRKQHELADSATNCIAAYDYIGMQMVFGGEVDCEAGIAEESFYAMDSFRALRKQLDADAVLIATDPVRSAKSWVEFMIAFRIDTDDYRVRVDSATLRRQRHLKVLLRRVMKAVTYARCALSRSESW